KRLAGARRGGTSGRAAPRRRALRRRPCAAVRRRRGVLRVLDPVGPPHAYAVPGRARARPGPLSGSARRRAALPLEGPVPPHDRPRRRCLAERLRARAAARSARRRPSARFRLAARDDGGVHRLRALHRGVGHAQPAWSFSRRSRLTTFGSALPPVSFITWPTR